MLADGPDGPAPEADVRTNAVVVGELTATPVTRVETGVSDAEVVTEEAAVVAVTTTGGLPTADAESVAVVTATVVIGGLVTVVTVQVVATLTGAVNDEVTDVVGATVTTGRMAMEAATTARSSLSTMSAHEPDVRGLKSSSTS